MQFPLINFREPVTKRGKTRMEIASTLSLGLGDDEVTEIRKRLATGLYDDVTEIEACEDGQVRRRYTVENGNVVRGVHFSKIDYECRNPLPLKIHPQNTEGK